MRIPLHLPADERGDTPEQARQRYDLHCERMAMNPRGWPTPPKRRDGGANRLARLAEAAHVATPLSFPGLTGRLVRRNP